VFTTWYRAMRAATHEAAGRRRDAAPPASPPGAAPAEAAYLAAAAVLPGAGMPGLERGLLPLALLGLRVARGEPATVDGDFGPYEPWARPHLLLARNERGRAAAALRALPDPPADLLQEALWCLIASAAAMLGDRRTLQRARARLEPAAGEIAGAGSGVLSLGPVARYLR